MVRVYVGIGSNIDRDHHIRAGVAALQGRFGPLQLSRVYRSTAVGFAGDDFYNLVAAFDSDLEPLQVAAELQAIEDANGRRREGPRFASRTLDIDLLLYGDLVLQRGRMQLPRDEVLTNAFVLIPLAEIAPDLIHPQSGRRIGEHAQDIGDVGNRLWPIAMEFAGIA